jgi:acyl carrier protein
MNNLLESEQSARLIPPITEAALRARIGRIYSLVIDLDKLQDGVPFIEAGADSLDFFLIISEIEEATGLNIPDEDVAKVTTLSDLASYLNERINLMVLCAPDRVTI